MGFIYSICFCIWHVRYYDGYVKYSICFCIWYVLFYTYYSQFSHLSLAPVSTMIWLETYKQIKQTTILYSLPSQQVQAFPLLSIHQFRWGLSYFHTQIYLFGIHMCTILYTRAQKHMICYLTYSHYPPIWKYKPSTSSSPTQQPTRRPTRRPTNAPTRRPTR